MLIKDFWNTIYRDNGEGGGGGGGGDAGGAAGAGGDAGGADSWFGGFSEANQQIVQKNGWADKDPEMVVQSYGELSSMLGNRNMDGYLQLPQGDAPWDDVWNKLGRPEDPTGYSSVELPEGHPGNDPTADWFRSIAHEAGLTKAQHDKILGGYYNDLTAQATKVKDDAYEADLAKGESALRMAWGTKFGDNMAVGNQAVNALGWGEDVVAGLQEVLGAEQVGMMLFQLGSVLGTDSGPLNGGTGGGGNSGAQGGAWAQQEITALKGDKDFMAALNAGMLDDPKWTGHIERWNKAIQAWSEANPGQAIPS